MFRALDRRYSMSGFALAFVFIGGGVFFHLPPVKMVVDTVLQTQAQRIVNQAKP